MYNSKTVPCTVGSPDSSREAQNLGLVCAVAVAVATAVAAAVSGPYFPCQLRWTAACTHHTRVQVAFADVVAAGFGAWWE
jgi:hypothetical protein